MNTSTTFSLIAIAISVFSAAVSFWAFSRDRPRLRVESNFWNSSEYGPAGIKVKAVNAGRRALILRLLGGDYGGRSWAGTFLGEAEKGLRLGENEFFEETIGAAHHMAYDPEGNRLVRLWFEDSLGRRYQLKDSAWQVERLLSDVDVGSS